MSEYQHQGISSEQIGHHHNESVTDPPAPIVVQDQFSFIAGVQAGQSSLFSIVNTLSKLKTKRVLVHDPSCIHFFSNNKLSNKKLKEEKLADVKVQNTRNFMQRFDSIEEAREFHRDLLSKPFTFKTEIGASEESNGATDFKSPEYETFVVTVFPQHPDVPRSFLEELVQAKDVFEKKQSCYFVIDFRSALAKWYKKGFKCAQGKNGLSTVLAIQSFYKTLPCE